MSTIEKVGMDWFQRITGFQETSYRETQDRLSVRDGRLIRSGSGHSYAVGMLSLPSLNELRTAVAPVTRSGKLRLSLVEGDVRKMHRSSENRGALFQVASQFNLLEMVGPNVTPEDGVTGYMRDHTQGPACAMAAGAATIFRNYLVPVASEIGQTAYRQLDALADLGGAFAKAVGTETAALWQMRNGYPLPARDTLDTIGGYLRTADAATLDRLRGFLRVGLQSDVETTDGEAPGAMVSQIFCSALPVAYGQHPTAAWAPFACLVLEAAYEATLWAGVLNAARGASNKVLLTQLGGGAFGNESAWIEAALLRALRLANEYDLDVAIVSYGRPTHWLRDLIQMPYGTAG